PPRLYAAPGAPARLCRFPTRRSSDLRSRLRTAALILLALVLALGLLLFWLAGTASGTRAVFSAVSSLTGDSIQAQGVAGRLADRDRKSRRLKSSHVKISYAVFCLKKN